MIIDLWSTSCCPRCNTFVRGLALNGAFYIISYQVCTFYLCVELCILHLCIWFMWEKLLVSFLDKLSTQFDIPGAMALQLFLQGSNILKSEILFCSCSLAQYSIMSRTGRDYKNVCVLIWQPICCFQYQLGLLRLSIYPNTQVSPNHTWRFEYSYSGHWIAIFNPYVWQELICF